LVSTCIATHPWLWRAEQSRQRGSAPPLDLRLFFAYAEIVSSTCRVSFTDGANITHTVTVSASSLYEAAALGVAEFKKSGFAFASIGPATRLTIAVEPPATTHELSVGNLQAWLETNGKTPREQATKVTLRQLLGRG
jgi:hypothetical protein